MPLLRTPLYDWHVAQGAKVVDFAGWEMPLLYAGIIQEHKRVRTKGGAFDVSHMGRVYVHGRHTRRFLEKLCTRRVSDMQKGQCRYSLICNEQGGVRDDVLVYRIEEDRFMLVVNAANRHKLLEHFQNVMGDWDVNIKDDTENSAMVALQGPMVMDAVGRVCKDIPELKRYRFLVKELGTEKITVSRTGYTGENGVEIILPKHAVKAAMKMLGEQCQDDRDVVRPVGLGARDTLRMEAGMPLYGHELGEDINAACCGVNFAMNLDKDGDENGEAFVGLDAVRDAMDDPGRILVGIRIDGKRSARKGMPILAGDTKVGEVTSACVSPTLHGPIAMGFVQTGKHEPGTTLRVDAGRATLEAETVPMPFYKAPKPANKNATTAGATT